MSHVIRVTLYCDTRQCGAKFGSDARAVGQARRWAAQAGWAVGLRGLGDGRSRYDFCPACKVERENRHAA